MNGERCKITPPMIAKRYGCSAEKVVGWIRRGELKAFDSASRRGGRARWLVDLKDLQAFEESRSAPPALPLAPRPRRARLSGVREFF